MFNKNSLLKSSVLALIAGLVVVSLVGVVGYSPATASSAAQAGQTLTVSGYATQYVGDDGVMFTDGTNTVKLEIENGSPTQIPLNTPVTITVQVKEAEDDGGFEVNLIEVKQTGEAAAPDAAPKLPVATVAQIKAQPVNNQSVVLQGQITQKIGDEEYLFTDGSGMIVLDVDDDVPASAVPLNTPVKVFGKVDVEKGRVEIDVTGIQPAS
jgi:uncharacterized protein (TIGR00156 family)